MKQIQQLQKTIDQRLTKKENIPVRHPAELGDRMGHLYADPSRIFVYARVGNSPPVIVFNNRVPAENGLKVWLGFTPEEPNLYQVLSTRSALPGGSSGYQVAGYAPAKRYEWMATGGGQDPLWVHLRAITMLRVGADETGELQILTGTVMTSSGPRLIAQQSITSYTRPTNAGKAAWLLITINDDGDVIATQGDEVDVADLPTTAPPAIPDGTVFASCAVRLYEGQTIFREARTNTDFWDLRFSGWLEMGFVDAPSDGQTYGRKDGAWEVVTGGTGGVAQLLMEDGVTFPPVPLTNEDGTDWIYDI